MQNLFNRVKTPLKIGIYSWRNKFILSTTVRFVRNLKHFYEE